MINGPNNETPKKLAPNCTSVRQEPPLYRVVVLNDDFTPMEFVVEILQRYFFMDRRRATGTMFEAHTSGKSTCGVFTKDIAESKIRQVIRHARKKEYPLICSTEAAL